MHLAGVIDSGTPLAKTFNFTKANARDMAAKAHAAARRRKLETKLALESASLLLQGKSLQACGNPDLEIVVEQIALTREALKRNCEPQARASLNRSLCLLMDRRRILLGEPLPGSKKPLPERRSRMSWNVEPITAPISPPPLVVSAPNDTTTGGVPPAQINTTSEGVPKVLNSSPEPKPSLDQ